jgi:hypothetical protein
MMVATTARDKGLSAAVFGPCWPSAEIAAVRLHVRSLGSRGNSPNFGARSVDSQLGAASLLDVTNPSHFSDSPLGFAHRSKSQTSLAVILG